MITTSSWDVPWRSMAHGPRGPRGSGSKQCAKRWRSGTSWHGLLRAGAFALDPWNMVKPWHLPEIPKADHQIMVEGQWKDGKLEIPQSPTIPNYPQLSVRVVQNHRIPRLQLPVVVSAMVSDLCRYIPHKYGSMVSNTDVQQQVNKKCKLFAHQARVTWPNDRLWQTLRHLHSFTSILKHNLICFQRAYLV